MKIKILLLAMAFLTMTAGAVFAKVKSPVLVKAETALENPAGCPCQGQCNCGCRQTGTCNCGK